MRVDNRVPGLTLRHLPYDREDRDDAASRFRSKQDLILLWPSSELPERKPGAANPCDYADGCVPGGCSEKIAPSSQG